MNKKQVLAELVKNLEECSERGYVFHPKFMYEFQVLLKNATGNEKEIFTLLVKQLNFLKELGTNVCKADSNEIIIKIEIIIHCIYREKILTLDY